MPPVVQFVSYDSPEDVGGVSSWLRKTLRCLRASGIDARVDLFCFGDRPGANADWYRANGIPFRWSPWRDDTRRATRQCLRWLREDLPSVYVPNCILPAYFAAASAAKCGVRTIGVLHSDDPFYWGIVDEFVHGPAGWRVGELVAVSRFLRDAVQAGAPMPVHEIPYGVRLPAVGAVGPARQMRLIYTGRLVEEQKRISDVTRALCRAVHQNPALEAWIVGGGPGEAAARDIIRAERLEGKVILRGRVEPDRVLELLRECHIFVLLSDYEGLPVSLLEAMAAGLVPVCLDIRSGVNQVLEHLANGMLVSDRGQSFEAAVAQLVGNPALWSRLSTAARQTIVAGYSDERCVERWKQLLLAGPGTVSSGCRVSARLELPPPNAKFGYYDHRPSGRWNRLLTGLRVFGSKAASPKAQNL